MDFLTWGRNPWDEPILTHVSWDLFWASLFAGVAFLVAHASYMVLSRAPQAARRRDRRDGGGARPICRRASSGTRSPARLFHWVMAAAMFVLLFTAFLPIVGDPVRLGHVALDGRDSC